MAGKKRFLLRIDEQLYAALERWAADDLRSVNAQIEYALRRALDTAGRTPRRVARGDEALVEDVAGEQEAGEEEAEP